ncbi:3-ketoacyl-CoA thiolase [Nymphon striatum]|nr:3-ketoacyl-CoA thiolase [Nymphon striatum]
MKEDKLSSRTHEERMQEAVDKKLLTDAEGEQLHELWLATREAIRRDSTRAGRNETINAEDNLLKASDLDEVIYGCMMPSEDEANIARVIALRMGGGDKLTAFTVQRNCASGLQAIDNAVRNISHGGVDAMSRAPLLLRQDMVHWLANWNKAKSVGAKIKALGKLKGRYFAPIIALLRGLTDPVVGLNMGQTAENLAYKFNITREQMDEYAVQSHLRLVAAMEADSMEEIEAIYDDSGQNV